MPLAEGVSGRITYKQYASGVITANARADSASDLGASGAQILRRVSSSLALQKDTYQSQEIVAHRQIQDFRHGTRRVSGGISGEFSPGTYWDFVEAACRGTAASAQTASESDYTSVAADNATSTITFASGAPATKYKIGDIVRFTNLSESTNNARNFVILAFGGTANRTVTVYPAPTTMSADTAFGMTSVGKSVYTPSSGHVARKFGIEVYNEDIDVARLYTECRVGGFNIQLPASGMSTIEVTMAGRDMEVYEGGAAPFFSAPSAATSTGILAAVNGLLRVGGSTVGVVTGLNVQLALNPTSEAVVGQNFVPEIYLGRANVSGQLTAFLQDGTLIGDFIDETEISLLAYLTASNAAATDAVTIYLPRLKLGGATVADSGESGQVITAPYQALLGSGTAAGDVATTIRITDTAA